MQDAALEVESNILASQKRKGDSDRRRPKNEASSSSNADPKLDKMTKTLKDPTSEIAKLKWESKQPNKSFQGVDNRNQNQFRRPNDAPQIR